jgi:ubiquinone/menaquinone biosynthesis C-methylase UbiE
MSSGKGTVADEAARAAELPQADARELVDSDQLTAAVKDMYRQVAREEEAELHFSVGRPLAERLGYVPALLDSVPEGAIASFAGVGHHFNLARISPGEAILDLGSGSGTDVFYAALETGPEGRVVGVDFTDEQVDKSRELAVANGFEQVHVVEGRIEELPFEDESFDVVISNGVINLSPAKDQVLAEAARVLKPGGRLAVADIVSGKPLKERTRRNVDLWAACVAGAIPQTSYIETIEGAGLTLQATAQNAYDFISSRALEACGTYEIVSVSFLATK